MTTTHDRLLQLAAQYDEKAKALRIAAAELNGHAETSAQAQFPDRLRQAIRLRTPSPVSQKATKTPRRSSAEWETAILQILTDAHGDPVTGIDIGRRLSPNQRSGNFFGHINALVKKKLIVQVNDGKPAVYALAQGAGRKRGGYAKSVLARREKTAKLLAHFDTDIEHGVPPGVSPQSVGVLVQHGLLKKVAEGQYLRTGKVFKVTR